MQAAIFISYFLLVSALIIYIPFFRNSGLKHWQLITLFIVKIVAGFGYAYFYKLPKYYKGADTWRFHRLSIDEKEWLLRDFGAFVNDLFSHGYDKAGNLFAGENSYWNDLKSNIIIKLMAIFNVATNNSYYTNIILFNFLFFFGFVALFKFFYQHFPSKKPLLIAGVFLLPSTLFWCSGIHKDGLILSALGLIIYCFSAIVQTKRFHIRPSLLFVFCIVAIFSLRNYIAIALLPALICWWLSEQMQRKKWLPFVVLYSIGILLFFSSGSIIPSLDFPAYVVQKQKEFSQLEGTSTIVQQLLEPSLISFIKFFPPAVDMAFLRPHITEAKSLSYIPAALENILLLIILLFAFFYRDRKQPVPSSFIFCIVFSCSILLLSGYTITLSGAIVRYRSISLPILVTPLLCLINFKKLKRIAWNPTKRMGDGKVSAKS